MATHVSTIRRECSKPWSYLLYGILGSKHVADCSMQCTKLACFYLCNSQAHDPASCKITHHRTVDMTSEVKSNMGIACSKHRAEIVLVQMARLAALWAKSNAPWPRGPARSDAKPAKPAGSVAVRRLCRSCQRTLRQHITGHVSPVETQSTLAQSAAATSCASADSAASLSGGHLSYLET